MRHSEIEELLGVYAIDAADPDETRAVESHLDECPRCRAELAQHRETASLLSASPDPAPSGLWLRISAALSEPDPEYAGHQALAPLVPIGVPRDAHRKVRAVSGVLGIIAAGAAALAVILTLQLSSLRHEVNLAFHKTGLAEAVSAALVSRHTDANLSSPVSRRIGAEVVITPGGESYWVRSNLPVLAPGETYQVWAVVNGKIVSLGLVGRDPSHYAAFRLFKKASKLLVTEEPQGGSPAPTGPVLISYQFKVAR